jgi:hypothetical protein
MRKRYYCFFIFLIVITIACTSINFNNIKKEPFKDGEVITGNFNFILYGGTHSEDLETVVILDTVDDKYSFVPYASEYQFLIKNNYANDRALQTAIRSIGWHYLFMRAQVSKILDQQSNLIGYEVKPLYMPLRFGSPDILDVHYNLRGDNIYFYVVLKDDLEGLFERGRDADVGD